jgi:hypothetical protein
MFRITVCVCAFLLLACCVFPMAAQQPAAASANAAVPPMVNFSGVLTDVNGKPMAGTVGVTFFLYKDSQGGAPLWMETQNVKADKAGHYTAALGATNSQGLPANVFASGEARWLGVQAEGQAEQPRVLLMSVPYAMKALDAETIGGKPLSAFMLAPAASSASAKGAAAPGTITGNGTADFVPIFTGTTTIGNSKIFQTVGGDVGIGNTAPVAKLDVKGTEDVRDTLTLFPKSTHPALTVSGTALSVDHTGKVTFVAGQTFPGTGTVKSVGSGAGLTGGPITTSGTLSIKTGGVTNAMLSHSSLTVNANSPLTGGGSVSLGGSTSLGLTSSCGSGQILKWNGSSWNCAADNNSGGTVTSVGSGFGLTGGPITSSGTLKIDTSVVPQLGGANSFSNLNAISVNSGSPDLSVSNAGSGDGIDIAVNSGNGVTVTSGTFGFRAQNAGSDAVVASGAFDAGYFVGDTGGGLFGTGVWSESDTDSNLTFASMGFAGGSTQETIGVEGYSASPSGFGVYGQQVTSSAVGPAFPSGVWGDSSAEDGIYGTSDSAAALGALSSDSNNEGIATVFFDNVNSSSSALILYAVGLDVGGLCTMTTGGVFSCNGALEHIAPVDSGARQVALNSIETPEHWFEDAGSGQLSHGEAVVNLEATFGQTVNTGMEYHVFLTPNGDCKGLYVAQKSPTSFVVRELGGGASSIAFDYRIMAKRKGYEQVRLADRTKTFRLPESPYGQGRAWQGGRAKVPSPRDAREKSREAAQRRSIAQASPVVKH